MTDYHYVITIRFEEHGGVVTRTTSGVLGASAGDTRMTLYGRAFADACRSADTNAYYASVLFFELQRNDLV
ncbi:hypothetical protein ACFXAZ_02020 [Streptomyces sp. NPDC059477]|uniref:hypothetical protein n=1 Tax=Streptomyces sp. NPDC059477 TaxID=3346847 RepID=UPI00367CE664